MRRSTVLSLPFNKTRRYLNEEVNCIEPSPSVNNSKYLNEEGNCTESSPSVNKTRRYLNEEVSCTEPSLSDNKTRRYLNEEVNCTEPSPSVNNTWYHNKEVNLPLQVNEPNFKITLYLVLKQCYVYLLRAAIYKLVLYYIKIKTIMLRAKWLKIPKFLKQF